MSTDPKSKTQLLHICINETQTAQVAIKESMDILQSTSTANSRKLDTLTIAICGEPQFGIEGVIQKQDRLRSEHSELKKVVNAIVFDKGVIIKTAAWIATITTCAWAVIMFIVKMLEPFVKHLIPVLLAAILLSGCGTTNRSMVIAPDLGGISSDVSKAEKGIGHAIETAGHVVKYGAMKDDPAVKAMVVTLQESKKNLADAQATIKTRQVEIGALTDSTNKMADRLNYLEPKYALANKAIWKRNWIIVGMVILIAGYGFLRFYLHLPI